MIIISEEMVLGVSEETHPNAPLIGYHNLVNVGNISASSEDPDFPVVNLANPITAPIARWQATTTGAQTITVEVNDEVDYLGIARHNLGSGQIPISLEGSTDGGSASGWFELVQQVLLSNDDPLLFRWTPQSLTHVRIVMGAAASGADPVSLGVVYVGLLLALQRRIYVGHTPVTYGRSETIVNGKTERGDFMGRIITAEERMTGVDMQNLTADWYREKMDPFIVASKQIPFFFAWRPGDYPNEVGFVWMTNNPQPRNQRGNGMMQIDIQMSGIA